MSKIDTKNSKSNLDCISDELFSELTSETSEVVQGGVAILYDLPDQEIWLGEYNYADKEFSDRANDDVSSVYITNGTWDFFEHKDYGGRSIRLGAGKHNLADHNFNQMMSSLKRVA